MADDAVVDADLGFDPSLKKKKKKKVKAFLDGEDGATESTTDGGPADDAAAGDAAAPATAAPVDAAADDGAADLDLDFSMKKKKKKKAATADEDAAAPESGAAADLDEDFMLTKKKKKKKTVVAESLADDDADDAQADKAAWEKENRDYTYPELLERVFEIMRQKNPGMMAGEKKRLVMKPPQVVRIGTKKSAFVNFTEICKMMHRQHDHLLGFLLAELGTSGSVDGSNALVMKGRFLQKQIENVLRRYIREYVTCHTCKSPDTILAKENRLFFLQCEMCGSKCSVASIKSGFQAVTGRRAAIRNKQA